MEWNSVTKRLDRLICPCCCAVYTRDEVAANMRAARKESGRILWFACACGYEHGGYHRPYGRPPGVIEAAVKYRDIDAPVYDSVNLARYTALVGQVAADVCIMLLWSGGAEWWRDDDEGTE